MLLARVRCGCSACSLHKKAAEQLSPVCCGPAVALERRARAPSACRSLLLQLAVCPAAC